MEQEFQLTGLSKLYAWIAVLSVFAVLLAYFSQELAVPSSRVLEIGAYLLGLFIALLTWHFAKKIQQLATLAEDRLLRISGHLTKVAALTMPILIGFLIHGLTQLLIVMAVILYKPKTQQRKLEAFSEE